MKFGIITSTFNRYNILKKNILSVKNQTYQNYTHIIIDDSTNLETYNYIKEIEDKKIKYIKNKRNKGVNFSRNVGLDSLGDNINYVTFLDDDDYFEKDTLEVANKYIKKYGFDWYISNRKNITKIKKYNTKYNYFLDYFIGNNINGDVTHIINRNIINNTRFSKLIKQGEEWLFFTELSENNNIYTYNHNSTISEYLDGGLTSITNNSLLKDFKNNTLAVFEFLLIRNISFTTKLIFIKKLFIYIQSTYKIKSK